MITAALLMDKSYSMQVGLSIEAKVRLVLIYLSMYVFISTTSTVISINTSMQPLPGFLNCIQFSFYL